MVESITVLTNKVSVSYILYAIFNDMFFVLLTTSKPKNIESTLCNSWQSDIVVKQLRKSVNVGRVTECRPGQLTKIGRVAHGYFLHAPPLSLFSSAMVFLSGSGFFTSVSVCFSLPLSKPSMFCIVFSWSIACWSGNGFLTSVSVFFSDVLSKTSMFLIVFSWPIQLASGKRVL